MRQNKQTKTKQKAIKKELNIKNYGEIFLYKHKILKIYKEFNFFNNCHYIYICRSAA